jgi:hypothetical protein
MSEVLHRTWNRSSQTAVSCRRSGESRGRTSGVAVAYLLSLGKRRRHSPEGLSGVRVSVRLLLVIELRRDL